VTVCHYPTGCSKWNPVEHRLFGPISVNWAGHPLRTWETMLAYLRGTETTTGLKVTAELHKVIYQKGKKVSKAEFAQLNIESHAVCPQWNYTLRPRTLLARNLPAQLPCQEVIS
jgi:Rhodopirellula transposase DDE domain